MNPKIAIVGGFAVAVALILFLSIGGKEPPKADPKSPDAAGELKPAGPQVELSMLYSSEKKEWVQAAAAEFSKLHPEIKLSLKDRGSLQAEADILDGKEKPTIFSPADSLVLNLLVTDWELKNHSEIVARSGEDQPQPLVITPLVFAIWEGRAKVLEQAGKGEIHWQQIHDAVASNQGWPTVGGKAEWGFVKLGHTDPTRSNSGLQTLLLMTLDYYKKTSGLSVQDVLDPKYQTWIKEVEKGVSKFETSTGTFMTDMVRFGPSKYDIAVVYENLAIAQLENAQGRWEPLKVYYPAITLWSDHPAAILQGDWVSEEQKKAARIWLEFLHSRPIQEKALSFGFRPGDNSVPLKTDDPKNPFTRLAPLGIKIEIPPVATPPDGAVIQSLLTMWSRVVGAR